MSEQINKGADWEQSKRLVVHWHHQWAKEYAALEAANSEIENRCRELMNETRRVDELSHQLESANARIAELNSTIESKVNQFYIMQHAQEAAMKALQSEREASKKLLKALELYDGIAHPGLEGTTIYSAASEALESYNKTSRGDSNG